jgi:hypothetical protein
VGAVWWFIVIAVLLAIASGLAQMWRAGRPDTSLWSRETTLYHAFQFTDWARCIDPSWGVSRIPDDPTVARLVEENWSRGGAEGALLVAESGKDGAGRRRRLLYLWGRHAEATGSAHYLANMDHVAFDHGSRGAGAAAIVRAITELVPGVRAAWVSDGDVGLALGVEEVTAPSAWATWLSAVAAAVPAGQSPPAPPSRWDAPD